MATWLSLMNYIWWKAFKNVFDVVKKRESSVSGQISIYIQKKYNYKLRYSKTTKTSSICNCCEHCDVLQGDFYLFNEVDSPFFIYLPEDVKKLKIYKISLEYDLIVNASDGWASFDEMFKKYGNIVPLDINIPNS